MRKLTLKSRFLMFVMKITNNTLLNKLKLKTMKIINLVLNYLNKK